MENIKGKLLRVLESNGAKVETVYPNYVKLVCQTCGHTWGVSVEGGFINSRDTICKECMIDRFYDDAIKKGI